MRIPSADSFRLRHDLPSYVSATIITALAGALAAAPVFAAGYLIAWAAFARARRVRFGWASTMAFIASAAAGF